MKIYLVSQKVNNGYDTYDSMVVCAEDVQQAKRIHPSPAWSDGGYYDEEIKEFWTKNVNGVPYFFEGFGSWTNDLNAINVEYIGEASKEIKKGVICASFNAG